AKPYAKGEGASLMVTDFVLPDYGWLKAKQIRNENGETLFHPGRAWDGYQTTEDILHQATDAMDILDVDYPDKKHVLAYDNATIHISCSPDALSSSATAMPANPNAKFF
ncbi:hypothetical protein EV361DRAFT_772024, partial [Lentinula raphanica]